MTIFLTQPGSGADLARAQQEEKNQPEEATHAGPAHSPRRTPARGGERQWVTVNPQEITHVLYHSRCDDGFGAAYSAWLVLGDKAQYIPVTHGDPPPVLPDDAVVAIVDFSYKRPVLIELHDRLRGLIVLDHHLTAQSELTGLDFVHFDMDHSGAHLAWCFFHPEEPPPELLRYVEDKDLWRFLLPESKEVTAALRSYPMSFTIWNQLKVEDLRREGVSMLRFQELQVDAACERVRFAQILEWEVPIVNATDCRSEIANRLCELYPQTAFAAAYYDNNQGFRCWSLRSLGDFDVADVAQRLGGGGHKNASGFVETFPCRPPPTKSSM